MKKAHYSLLVIWGTIFTSLFITFYVEWYKNDKIIVWDAISYYAYLPSVFIYKDPTLSFLDKPENAALKLKIWYNKDANDNKVIKTAVGEALLIAPFFLTAHYLAPAFGVEQTGFTWIYSLGVVLAALFYALIGGLLLRKLLLRYFSDKISAWAILITMGVSNFFYYLTFMPGYSHVYSFFAITLFTYYVVLWFENKSIKNSFLIGVFLGLIFLLRPTNIIVVLFLLLYKVNNWQDVKERFVLMIHQIGKIGVMFLGALLLLIIQFSYWKASTGNWIMYSYSGEPFFWKDPKIWEIWFGYRKGWFMYTPIMFVGMFGFIFLKKYVKDWFWAFVVFFLLNTYIIASWWCWWYGGCFSMRPYIDSYVIMAFLFASLFTWLQTRKLAVKIPVTVVTTALSALTIFMSIKYYYGSIHFDGMNRKVYYHSFFHVHHSAYYWHNLSVIDYGAALKGERDE